MFNLMSFHSTDSTCRHGNWVESCVLQSTAQDLIRMSLPCDFPELPAQRVMVVTTEYIYIYNYRLHLRNDSVDVVVVVVVDGEGGIHLHLQLQATSTEQYRHRGFPAPPLDWPNVLWLIILGIAKVSVSSLYSPSQNVPVSLPINKHSRVSVQLDWCLNHTIVFR